MEYTLKIKKTLDLRNELVLFYFFCQGKKHIDMAISRFSSSWTFTIFKGSVIKETGHILMQLWW